MTEQEDQMWCIGCWAKLEAETECCKRCGRRFSPKNSATYYCREVNFLSGIDLHVVYLILMLGLLGLLIPWPVVAAVGLFLMPQPMIATHAIDRFAQHPDEIKLIWAYILVNEAFVTTTALLVMAIGSMIR